VVSSADQPFQDAVGQASGLAGVLGVLLALLALGGGGYGVYRYVSADEAPADDPPAASATSDVDQPPAEEGNDTAETPPAELLSNEEQVLKLLNEAGGRVKQQQVASELDWTAAKTSQVIGGLREDDELETFRIGRENVVTLPDTELTDGEEPEESSI